MLAPQSAIAVCSAFAARVTGSQHRTARITAWATRICVTAIGLAASTTAPLDGQQPVVIQQAAMSVQPENIPAPPPAGQPTPSAPPSDVLTLDDLERIALEFNPSVARAQALVGAARGNQLQVGLPPNFSWGYLGQQIGSGNRATQHAALLDGEIVTGRKLPLNRAVAEQEVAFAEQQLAAQQQRVVTDVRIAFYDALLAQRQLELAQQLLQIAKLGQGTAERLKKAGETSEIDLLQATLEVEFAENVLNSARNRHAAAWWGLTAVSGVPQLRPVALRGDLDTVPPDISWDETLGRLLAISPEIAAAMTQIDRARWFLTRARVEPIPNVRLQGGVMQDQGIGGKTDGIIQFLLPLPLINRNQGAIRQAESELVAAERALQQVELDLQNRLAPVFERHASAANQVRRYRERILPTAQQSLDRVRLGYDSGEFPYLYLLNAQQKYFQSNLQYLESLRQLRSSAAEIDGLLLKNSLSTNPAAP